MVKKLLKYEFISYLRTLMPMYVILLATGILNRLIQFFENDHFSYNILFTSSLVALLVSAIVCLVMTVVVGITRFYKNLYSAEGYLSFTLPVTADQHIFAKLSMLVIFSLIGVFAILSSLSIAMMGEVLVEVFKAIAYIFEKLYAQIGTHLIFYIIEIAVLLLLSSVYMYLLYYGCITIGQTAKKNRILAAFGIYFIYYLITQALGTVIVIIGMFFGQTGVLEELARMMEQYPLPALHVIFSFSIVVYTALSVAYYFIIRHFMNKKLNLE